MPLLQGLKYSRKIKAVYGCMKPGFAFLQHHKNAWHTINSSDVCKKLEKHYIFNSAKVSGYIADTF
jgi:hypothetical protein